MKEVIRVIRPTTQTSGKHQYSQSKKKEGRELFSERKEIRCIWE
jgi:hypothetical protein